MFPIFAKLTNKSNILAFYSGVFDFRANKSREHLSLNMDGISLRILWTKKYSGIPSPVLSLLLPPLLNAAHHVVLGRHVGVVRLLQRLQNAVYVLIQNPGLGAGISGVVALDLVVLFLYGGQYSAALYFLLPLSTFIFQGFVHRSSIFPVPQDTWHSIFLLTLW